MPDELKKDAPASQPEPEQDSGERESRIYSAPFRIAGSRGSSIPLPDLREELDRIRPVAKVLVGAAPADSKFFERWFRVFR